MPSRKNPRQAVVLILPLLAGVFLAACGTLPESPAIAGKKSVRQAFEGPLLLDYEVDTKISAIDGKSCYAFISGSLENQSAQRLSRQSELHFHVYHAGGLLFNDLARLRADLPPGNRVQFQFIESPLHNKSCPSYDRIDVTLKKVVLP